MELGDAKSIIKRGFESKDLDYKGPMIWNENDKKACCEIVKDILSMANTNGGWVVIGVAEENSGFNYVGLSDEQLKTFESSRVNRYIQKYADPPIHVNIIQEEIDGRKYIIIEIPQFKETPHICVKDFPGVLTSTSIYVRNDSNESARVNSSHDLRGILENSIRNRQDQLLELISSFLKKGEVVPSKGSDQENFDKQIMNGLSIFDELNPFREEDYGYREAWLVPTSFLVNRIDQDTLIQIAKRSSIDFRGMPYLFYDYPKQTNRVSDTIQTFLEYSHLMGEPRVDFWKLYQSGLFIKKELIYEDFYTRGQPEKALDINLIAFFIIESIICLYNLYKEVFVETDYFEINLIIRNALTRKLYDPDAFRRPIGLDYTSMTPEIHYKKRLKLIEWKIGSIDQALEISEHIYKLFHWDKPNLDYIKGKLEKIYSRRT